MARLIKCPRCTSPLDVTSLSAGSTVRCADCGAMVRVPTGKTSVRVAPVAPAPAAPAAPPAAAVAQASPATAVRARGSRGTEMRRREGTRVVRRKSNTGLIVGSIFGAAVLVIIAVAVMMGGSKEPKGSSSRGGSTAARAPERTPEPDASPPPARAPAPAPGPAKPADEPPKPAPITPRDPAKANWDDLMKALRPGGGFDDTTRPEGLAFQTVKAMGKGAYPYILRYFDHEELPMAVAAHRVLCELTGQNKPGLTLANKAQLKGEWEAYVKANP
jgi:hypothetical protein